MSSATYRGRRATHHSQDAARRQEIIQQQLADRQKQEEAQRKRRRTIIIVIIIISVIIVIGIAVAVYFLLLKPNTTNSGGGGGGGGGSTLQPLGGNCQDSSQCVSGLICSAGTCKNPPQSTCTTSTTCPNGYVCSNTKCKGLLGATCGNSNDCSGQFQCLNQTCSIIPCTVDTDCPNADIVNHEQCASSVCIGGHLDGCASQSQCFNRFVCTSAQVCAGILGDPCVDTTECSSPFVCTSGVCAVEPCVVAGDCTNAQGGTLGQDTRCDSGACANAVSVHCVTQEECGDPIMAVCDGINTINGGVCRGLGGILCFDDNDCALEPCVANPDTNDDACGCSNAIISGCIPAFPNCIFTNNPNLHFYCSTHM